MSYVRANPLPLETFSMNNRWVDYLHVSIFYAIIKIEIHIFHVQVLIKEQGAITTNISKQISSSTQSRIEIEKYHAYVKID